MSYSDLSSVKREEGQIVFVNPLTKHEGVNQRPVGWAITIKSSHLNYTSLIGTDVVSNGPP